MSLKKKTTDTILTLKELNEKYEQIKPLIEEFKTFIEEFIGATRKVELDHLIDLHSSFYDDLILRAIYEEQLTFAGGELIVDKDSNKKSFSFFMEAYFKNVDGDWIKKEHHISYPLSYLVEKDRHEFLTGGELKYDLEAPTEKEVTP